MFCANGELSIRSLVLANGKVGPTGKVIGLERIGKLVEKSESNVAKGNPELLDRIKFIKACS